MPVIVYFLATVFQTFVLSMKNYNYAERFETGILLAQTIHIISTLPLHTTRV